MVNFMRIAENGIRAYGNNYIKKPLAEEKTQSVQFETKHIKSEKQELAFDALRGKIETKNGKLVSAQLDLSRPGTPSSFLRIYIEPNSLKDDKGKLSKKDMIKIMSFLSAAVQSKETPEKAKPGLKLVLTEFEKAIQNK